MVGFTFVRVAGLVVAASLLASCGDDDGPTSLEATLADTEGGLVDVEDASCRREGDQLRAEGVVHNRGDNPHYVTVSVRFVDGDGVRVELTNDSVSDLVTSESARWDVNVFTEAADTVVGCEISAEAS
jgi:hypothetical protein